MNKNLFSYLDWRNISIISWILFILIALSVTFFLVTQISLRFDEYIAQNNLIGQSVRFFLNNKNVVAMTAKGFKPKELTITVGEKITFINNDTEPHWPATGPHDHHDEKYSAGSPLYPGGGIMFAFLVPGQWQYHDHLYQENEFTLTVISNKPTTSQNNSAPTPSATSVSKSNCTPSDSHSEGLLTAKFNSSGSLIGWACTMGTHMNCTAGPDGIWKECDFPPDLMVWPPRVPQSALDNPRLYVPSKNNF